MKARIPADIDALMWSVAESGDDQAIAEFGQRYPDYRQEMVKRLSMVRAFKGARPPLEAFPASPPRFQQPLNSPTPRPWQRFGWVVAPIVLAGVAFGSYTVAMRALGESKEQIKAPITKTDGFYKDPNEVVLPERENIWAVPDPDREPPIVNNRPNTGVPSFEKPIDAQFEGLPLSAAVLSVAVQAGLQIEVAPGMPDIMVSGEYAQMKGIEIIRDMGQRFGFSVFEQEPGKILVIPAVDREAPATGEERGNNPSTTPEPPRSPDGTTDTPHAADR